MDTYGLKYTSGDITREGVVYRLNIYQRSYTGATLEIGDLQALSLEVQGASGGVDQPIVKTLLHFTVADTVDMGTVGGVKHGGWEEFYTPDATLYKVQLRRGGLNIWEGFITPDSWSDGLVYRGSVTVTARDNIGHMRDSEFSKAQLLEWMAFLGGDSYDRVRDDNLVSIYELLFAAFNVSGVAMTLRTQWDAQDAGAEPHLKAGTEDVEDWLVDIDALQDMDWYQAVEKVLASAGLVLRYTDKGNISLMSLRSLHKMGNAGTPPAFAVNFVNRSGHRTLDPAYKQIVERLDYDATDGYDARWEGEDFDVEVKTISGVVRYVSSLTADSDWTQDDGDREVLRFADPEGPLGGDVAGEADRYVLVAGRSANVPSPTVGPADDYEKKVAYIDLNNFAESKGKRLSPNTVVSIGFDVAHSYSNAGASTGFSYLSSFLPCGAVRYAIMWRKSDGTYLSLQDSEWVQGVFVREVAVPAGAVNERGGVDAGAAETITVSDTFQTPDMPGALVLRLYPYRIDMEAPVFQEGWLDAHVRVGHITFDINTEAIPRYFKTATVYDETQNYTLKRDVEFGAVPTRFTAAGTVRNGFYKDDAAGGYPSIMDCHWDGEQQTLPLPVLNHLQILSLHAKANNILTGELRDAAGTPIRWDGNWTYAGRKFLLISGIWNILTGRVQDAMLREYDTYAEAIGSIEADYTTDLSGGDARLMALQKSVNAAASLAKNSGGSGGGGGGGGTGTVTSVALSIPTYFDVTGSPVTGSGTLTATLKSTYKIPSTTEWNSVNGAKHSHDNLSILDLFDQGYVNDIDEAISDRHSHSNWTALSQITTTKINHWDAAYDAIGSLPDIDSHDIENWDDAASKAHEHSNYSTLNGITDAKVTAWDGAVSASHSHSNYSILDGITQAKVTAWDGAASQAHSHSNYSTLNGITDAKVTSWDNAASKAHEHSNYSVLDGITSAKVSSWDNAASKAHEHSNRSVLDGITSAKVSAWDDAAAAAASIDVGIGGTDAAPTVEVELGSGASDSATLPVATASKAGIVSTAAQTFAGAKTFDRIYLGNSQARGAYIEWDDTARAFKLVGDFYATGDVAAGN